MTGTFVSMKNSRNVCVFDDDKMFIETHTGDCIKKTIQTTPYTKRENSEEIDKLKKFSMLLVEEKQSAMKRDERFNERIKATESEMLVCY